MNSLRRSKPHSDQFHLMKLHSASRLTGCIPRWTQLPVHCYSLLQISRRYWYYVTVPMWWFLVVYAVLDLVLIYTYQFPVVSNAWDSTYQRTSLNISSEDL